MRWRALAIEFVFGLALALLVDSLAHGRALFRVSLLAPMLLPPVVAAVIWRLIYNPEFGVLNGMLRQFGFNTAHLTWTSGRTSAHAFGDPGRRLGVDAVSVPAAHRRTAGDSHRSLSKPRASTAQAIGERCATSSLPLLKPVILLALLLRSMDLLRIFDQIFILTQGGPGVGDGNGQPLHLPHRVSIFELRLRGRDVVSCGWSSPCWPRDR